MSQQPLAYEAVRTHRHRRIAASLPYGLGKRLTQRTIEDVHALPRKAQSTLSAALDLGLGARKNKISKAVRELQRDPLQDVFALLGKVGVEPCITPDILRMVAAGEYPEHVTNLLAVLDIPLVARPSEGGDVPLPEGAYTILRELMQVCFPGMTGIAADAYTRTDQMKPLVRLVYEAHKTLERDDIQDAEVVLLAGWVEEMLTQVGGIIDQKQSYQRAVAESGVLWEH